MHEHRHSATPCQPGCPACDFGPFTRNHYFTGKLLVERDFRDEQRYYIDKLRHHHQRLHGWGVVCGLKVTPHENSACRDRYVCVEPGTAIDCCGREILVKERDCIDITKLPSYQTIVDEGSGKVHKLQICIRYRECPTEEIPVLYDECGCDETRCAPNRILESYEIDLLVDREVETTTFSAPKLDWRNIGVAHAQHVALHEDSHRLYVLNADGAVVVIDTEHETVLSPPVLPDKGLAIAVSTDGARLYVAVDTAPRGVLVFDTANLTAPALRTLPIDASAGSDIELTIAPTTGRLLALVSAPGRILAWNTDVNGPPGLVAPPDDITLSPNLRSLVISSNGQAAYAIDRTNHQVRVANLAPAGAGNPIIPPGTLDLWALAVVRSTAPDMLVAVAQTQKSLHLFSPTTAGVFTAPLANTPQTVAISPDGRWAYVVERNGAQSFIEIINLFQLQQGLPLTPFAPFQIGDGAAEIATNPVGDRLFVPWTGNLNTDGDGGVASIAVAERDCLDFLRDCCSCDEPNCVVLATIERYTLGAAINNIDNHKGRHILPSTQALKDALLCALEHGTGEPGPQGPPGPSVKGDKGEDGLGLNRDLPKIIDIGWTHGDSVPFEQWMKSSFYKEHPKELRNKSPLLTIYFNRDDMRGIDRQTFRVSIEYPLMLREKLFMGIYNQLKIDIYGLILPVTQLLTPHTSETAKSAFAFVPYREFFDNAATILADAWLGENYELHHHEDLRLDLPVVRVVLKGDFVFAGPTFKEDGVLDGENIGGNVGLNITRNPPIVGGKNPSGNLTQGGDFESWFFLKKGEFNVHSRVTGLNRLALVTGDPSHGVNVNTASPEELHLLPGVSDALVRRIVRARDAKPFRDFASFRERAEVPDKAFDTIRNFIVLG